MENEILIRKMLKELDDAWERFIRGVIEIKNKYRITLKPVNRDIWLTPLCYKIEEVIKQRKNSVKYFVVSFDENKMKHKLMSGKEILLDEKGGEKEERWIFRRK